MIVKRNKLRNIKKSVDSTSPKNNIKNEKTPIIKNDDMYYQMFLDCCMFNEPMFYYLHNTSKETAAKILSEGFLYSGGDLSKTTDRPPLDIVALKWFLTQRKSYGNCTLIIHIGRNLAEKYYRIRDLENFLSEETTDYDEDSFSDNRPIRLLPNRFIKGYFDWNLKTFIKNQKFDPYSDDEKLQIKYNERFKDGK